MGSGGEVLAKLHLPAAANREGNRGLRTRSDGYASSLSVQGPRSGSIRKSLQSSRHRKNKKEEKQLINAVVVFVALLLVKEDLGVVFVVSSPLLLSSGEAGAGKPPFYTVLARLCQIFGEGPEKYHLEAGFLANAHRHCSSMIP